MATYVNDLRLKEISTGDESGTWGTSTNTNLELIAEAFSFGTEAITTNADTHTTTIADGSTDPGRSMFLKYTGTLDSACTITIGPNTVSKLWFIENATSGSQSIIIKQGSGATITIANGQVKAIYSDGAGSGGAMVDAFQDLSVPDLFIDDDLTFTSDSAVITFGADGDTTLTHTDGSGLTLNSTNKIMFNDASQFIQGSSATVLALGATDEIDLTATLIDINGNADVSGTVTATGTSVFASLDISGDIDVDGTANLDVVDIDGAVDMASTLQVDGAITSSAGATITVADNSDNLTLTSTDADASAGPNLRMYRNSGSPADSDAIGLIDFEGRNDNSQDVVYAAIDTRIVDASDGTEDGRLEIATILAGTAGVSRILMDATETVFNDNSKDLDFRVESDANTHALFVEGSSSNVGIGTSSPASLLTIQDATPVFEIDSTTTSNTATIQFTSSGTVDSKITHVGNTGVMTIDSGRNSSWGGKIVFVTDTETRMTIGSSGNVLVGVSNEGATGLSLANNYNVSFSEGSNLSFANVFRQATSGATVIGSGYKRTSTGNKMAVSHSSAWAKSAISVGYAAIKFFTDAETTVAVGTDITPTERMRIDSTGKVFIGTSGTSFNERLTVNSNSAPYSAHLFAGSGATAPLICRNQNGVSGSRSQIIFYYDSSAVGSITSTPSATGYGTSSDQRLKSNIEDADDAGSKVDAIQVRKFDWKVDGSHQDYGMVAQELQAVAPEAVQAPEDPDEMMAVDYSKLVPMLVKEIQSLRARVAQLENN